MIEQAKGMLAERESVSPDEAFEKMRREARSQRVKLHNVAAEIISTVGKPADKLLS